MHTDGSQTRINCWQLSADHGAHFWAFADFLIPRNAHGLYRYQVFFLDTAWMACAQRAGVHEEKVSHYQANSLVVLLRGFYTYTNCVSCAAVQMHCYLFPLCLLAWAS